MSTNQPIFRTLPRLPPRRSDSHKGDFGRVLLVGGARGMSGAIALAGMASLRSGAGLVRLAVPDVCLETVAGFEPSYMTAPLPCDDQGRINVKARQPLEALLADGACLACGPGLGRSEELTTLVRWLYTDSSAPAVFDADALNALAASGGLARAAEGAAAPMAPRVLTPHPGEFRRLAASEDLPLPESPADFEDAAVTLAARHGVVVLLKGNRTLVTDGQRRVRNTTGNPGMATGGSGDVLTGVIAALLAQGLAAFEAAQLGAHAHGLAGDLAAARLGQVGMIARDLVEHLPEVFRRL